MLVMVAVFKSSPKEVAGFRLMDCSKLGTPGGKVSLKDVDYNTVAKALTAGTLVENLEIVGGAVKGSNGALSSYTQLTTCSDVIGSKTPAVVLYRTTDDKFIMASHTGAVTMEDYDSAVVLAERIGVANGKVRTLDGKKVLSSIRGNYPELTMASTSVDKDKAKNKFITVSDDYTVEDIIKRIDIHISNPGIKIIGKISSSKTDDLIKKLTNTTGMLSNLQKKNSKEAVASIHNLTGNYMPVIRTIGDRRAIVTNLTGLKAVFGELTAGSSDMFEKAVQMSEDKAIKLSSHI